jgi:hypothetical protein
MGRKVTKRRAPGALPLDKRLDRIEMKVDRLITDVATLKVKAGIWGAIGAALAWFGLQQGGCR